MVNVWSEAPLLTRLATFIKYFIFSTLDRAPVYILLHLCDVRPNYSKFQIPVGSISAGQTLNLTFHLVYLWTWSRGSKVSLTSQLKSAQNKHPRYWDWRRFSLCCVAATGGQCNPGGGSNEAVDGKRSSVLALKDSVKSAVHAACWRQFWWLQIHCPFPSKVRI